MGSPASSEVHSEASEYDDAGDIKDPAVGVKHDVEAVVYKLEERVSSVGGVMMGPRASEARLPKP